MFFEEENEWAKLMIFMLRVGIEQSPVNFLAEWLSILSLLPGIYENVYSSDFCIVSCLVSVVISSIGFGGGVVAIV